MIRCPGHGPKIVRLHAPDYDNTLRPVRRSPCSLLLWTLQMILQKGLRGASLREIKEDIKVLLLIRYKGHGFKLPRLVYLNTCCNDREVFMEIYEELRAMGLEMEVEDETPADVVTQLHPPSTLVPLHSTHHTTQVHSAQ